MNLYKAYLLDEDWWLYVFAVSRRDAWQMIANHYGEDEERFWHVRLVKKDVEGDAELCITDSERLARLGCFFERPSGEAYEPWRQELGKEFYYVAAYGSPVVGREEGGISSSELYAAGNYYKTFAEARDAGRRVRAAYQGKKAV